MICLRMRKVSCNKIKFSTKEKRARILQPEKYKLNMFLKLFLIVSAAVYIEAERSHSLCENYGCFDSRVTQLSATLDDDEIYYADFKDDLLIWDSKIPNSLHVSYAYTYAVRFRDMCKNDISRWKPDKATIKYKEPPQIIIYPRDEVIPGEDNTLICFINYFFPPVINITWTKNDKEIRVEDPFIKCLTNPDGTFHVISQLDFVPEKGDIYSCTVDHEALEEPQTKFWEVETDDISIGPSVLCGLGLSLGVLGVTVGTFFFVKGSRCEGTLDPAG